MKKQKLKLDELRLQSFITSLESDKSQNIMGASLPVINGCQSVGCPTIRDIQTLCAVQAITSAALPVCSA